MTLNWWENDGVNLSGQDSLALDFMLDKQTTRIQVIYLPNPQISSSFSFTRSIHLVSSHIVWLFGGPALLFNVNVDWSILKLETKLFHQNNSWVIKNIY